MINFVAIKNRYCECQDSHYTNLDQARTVVRIWFVFRTRKQPVSIYFLNTRTMTKYQTTISWTTAQSSFGDNASRVACRNMLLFLFIQSIPPLSHPFPYSRSSQAIFGYADHVRSSDSPLIINLCIEVMLLRAHHLKLVTLYISSVWWEKHRNWSITCLRIVPLGSEGIVCVYEGPCAYLENDYACFLIYILVLHGFTMYNIQMTANFCFR